MSNWINTTPSGWVEKYCKDPQPIQINEWFVAHPECELGDRAHDKLTQGKRIGVKPRPNQNLIKDLRSAYAGLLHQQQLGETTTMTTQVMTIPSSKFVKTSPYAFILRENPVKVGVEVHFPPNVAPNDKLQAKLDEYGFAQSHKNAAMWYVKQSDSPQSLSYWRKLVKTCSSHGAYEIDSSVSVESLPDKARSRSTSNISPVAQQVIDALSERLDKLEALVGDTKEVETLQNRVAELARENNELRGRIDELETSNQQLEGIRGSLEISCESLTLERDELQRQLDEFLGEGEVAPDLDEPNLDDDEDDWEIPEGL